MTNRTYLQNIPVDIVTYTQALNRAMESIENNKNLQVVTINPEMITNAKRNPAFANVLNHAELIIADGVGIKIAMKLKGINQERIGGVDFSRSLIELCVRNNYRLALLGAKDEVTSALVSKLKSEYNDINIVFAHNGYFNNEEKILDDIKKAAPQVFLCALGSPKQEMFIYRLKEMLQGCVMVGVGGSFDVFAGYVKRAPKIWQKLGLEWLYRVIKQPERFKRIFPALPIFLFESIMDSVRK